MLSRMPSLTFPFTFLQLSKTGVFHEFHICRSGNRAISFTANYQALWGTWRCDFIIFQASPEPFSTRSRWDHLLHIQEVFRMNYENQILDALMIVSAWDIPDEDFADAVNDQAMLMAGVNPDDIPERQSDTH